MCLTNLPRMLYAMCVAGVFREIVTKHDTNAQWSLSKSRLVLCSVSSVIDGSGVKVVWQCINVEVELTTNRPAVNQFPLVCVFGRQFRRFGDLKRHKCRDPQPDEVQCPTCQRWFKNTSRGLTIHQRAKHQV